ncbi:MAG: CDP-alcohol phosphatidyltransferase family protein [Candidatus Hermodarchaeota archaeon]
MSKLLKFTKIKRQIPNLLSIFRVATSPLLFFFIWYDVFILAFFLCIIDIVSDVLDGYIARRFKICSKLGGILDILGDFSFIFLIIIALTIRGVFPPFVLIVVIVMFLQFLLTSKIKKPIYDPIGKYYGSFLFIILGITLIDFNAYLYNFVLISFIIFTLLSVSSRIYFLIYKKSEIKDLC